MSIHFTKMHGAGNDFVVIDNRTLRLDDTAASRFAQRVCHRRFGIGADGLLLLDPGGHADFGMRYYNADGSRSFCANGARCIARFAYRRGLVARTMTFEADDGVHTAEVEEKTVQLGMTDPSAVQLHLSVTNYPRAHVVHAIDTGAPHAVARSEDVASEHVEQDGRALRYHPLFQPDGANVNFAQRIDRSNIAIRTYERGVEAETLSCGTGAVAAAVVMTLLEEVEPPVTLHTRSGEALCVDFSRRESTITGVTLQGGAHIVYEGEI